MRHHHNTDVAVRGSETEEHMFQSLLSSNTLGDDITLCHVPLSTLIESLGIPGTQQEIDKIGVEGKALFVCDHYLIDRLNFGPDSILATTQATIERDQISIPHYPRVYDRTFAKNDDRSKLFCFFGNTQTNDIRRGLVTLFPNNCFSSDSIDDGDETYLGLLRSSDFSICPRGIGISTTRIFDSMATGSIPVIVANGYKPPLHTIIDWSSIAVFVMPGQISKLGMSLQQSFNKKKISDMRSRMADVYDQYFSPENFQKSIELSL